MNRREFSMHTLGAAGLAGLGVTLPGLVQAQGPVEGTNYVKLAHQCVKAADQKMAMLGLKAPRYGRPGPKAQFH